jgi:cytosine/adenosine deaminase-related metal-dependent hydrolase
MERFEGTILRGETLEPVRGRVLIDNGEIMAVEEEPNSSTDIILPAFVNAHTHLGDSVATEAAVGLSLTDAVAPPDSLKHRRLSAVDRETLIESIYRTLGFMQSTGTGTCLDFRESGLSGATALRSAASKRDLTAFIFGSGEDDVLDVADGYGASGATDDDFSAQRTAAQMADMPFGIHAGEPDASDIHAALALDPDLLIHMVHAEAEHLTEVADNSIPVVVCPRANHVLDVGRPPIRELLDHTTVALGTDNVMLNSPSMFREMAYTAKHFDVTAREVLQMATIAGAEAVGLNCGVIDVGRRAALLIIDGDSNNLSRAVDPIRAVVRRAGPLDVSRVVL